MSAGKDLQVVNENGEIVAWDDFDIDWGDDGTEDITPSFPMVRIVQATSGMPNAGKHGGEFYHSDREEFEPSLECVALMRRNTRAKFNEGEDTPACMSPDGIAPFPDQPLWQGKEQPTACAACPFSEWGEDGTPPACKESDVLLIDRGGGDLAQLRIGGKSLKPFRQFVKQKVRGRMISGPGGKRRPTPLYFYRLNLATTHESGNSRNWYELVVKGEQMGPAEIAGYTELVRRARDEFGQHLDAPPAATDDDWATV